MGKMVGLAAEERRAYKRAWNAKNPKKNAEYMERYWARRAEKRLQAEAGAGVPGLESNITI